MKIYNIRSYRDGEKTGMSADIELRASTKKYTLFFEQTVENALAVDGTAFLAAMIPVGMFLKESIEVEGVVSTHFYKNIPAILETVTGWNKGFSPVKIEVSTLKKDTIKAKYTGCFFSGGADSYYTYLKNKKKITNLIFVHGFDIKIGDKDLYTKIENNIATIADSENVSLTRIKTNIREIYEEYFDWDLVHGFAVGSVALALRNQFSAIYVSCGLPTKHMDHHSMTPELDPLWSGDAMNIIHYGCSADKLAKLTFLSRFPIVMKTLRVCWVNTKNSYNCCRCEKCLRNMLGLYCADALHKCQTFNKSVDLNVLENTKVSLYVLKYFKAILNVLEEKNDKSPIRKSLEVFIVKNEHPTGREKVIATIRMYARHIDKQYNHNRLYWFLARQGIV